MPRAPLSPPLVTWPMYLNACSHHKTPHPSRLNHPTPRTDAMQTPPTDTAANPANDVLRQCQNCWERQTAEHKLLSCARCKRAHYCSKECQVAHWPRHKDACRVNVQSRAEARAAAGAVAGVGTVREVEQALKRFAQTRRAILTVAALEAFALDTHPENVRRCVLWVELEHTALPPPREFRLRSAEVCTVDDVRASYQAPSAPALLEHIDLIQQQSREIERQGGLGIAIAIVSCGSLKHLMPLGISDKPSDSGMRFPNREMWLEKLRLGIERTLS